MRHPRRTACCGSWKQGRSSVLALGLLAGLEGRIAHRTSHWLSNGKFVGTDPVVPIPTVSRLNTRHKEPGSDETSTPV